jgi:hypothetical protein
MILSIAVDSRLTNLLELPVNRFAFGTRTTGICALATRNDAR